MINKIIKPLLIFIGLIFIMSSAYSQGSLEYFEITSNSESEICYNYEYSHTNPSYDEVFVFLNIFDVEEGFLSYSLAEYYPVGKNNGTSYNECITLIFPDEFSPTNVWIDLQVADCSICFGTSYAFNGLIGFGSPTIEIIEGCMDNTAINYNPNANFDDGTCEYETINETENTDGFFNSFLSDVGNGLGSFLSSVSVPIMYLILVLAIGSAIVGVIYSITNLVKGKMK